MTRLHLPADRCKHAIRYEDGWMTRCLLHAGHTGPGGKHEGKGPRPTPYRRVIWYGGDDRETITEKGSEFAWRVR